jgi:hypothetical protein
MTMTAAARWLRAAHTLIAAVELTSLGYAWSCASTGRRDTALRVAVTMLVVEGVALGVGGGDCPLGPLQGRHGDPVPLFELVLPPRAAKAAVPVLAAASCLGIGVLEVRSWLAHRPTFVAIRPR